MSVPLPSGYTASLLPAIAIAVQLGVGAGDKEAAEGVRRCGRERGAEGERQRGAQG